MSQADGLSPLQTNDAPSNYEDVHVVHSSPIAPEIIFNISDADSDSSLQPLPDYSSDCSDQIDDSLTDCSLPGSEDEFQDDLADWAAKLNVTHLALSALSEKIPSQSAERS